MKKTLMYWIGLMAVFSIPVSLAAIYYKVPFQETGSWFGIAIVVAALMTAVFEPWKKR